MDEFSSYNQISMAPEDQNKIAFVTKEGLFCYRVMLFGLRNAGATYQRLVNNSFKEQTDRFFEVYPDDLLVKSSTLRTHIPNSHMYKLGIKTKKNIQNNRIIP